MVMICYNEKGVVERKRQASDFDIWDGLLQIQSIK